MRLETKELAKLLVNSQNRASHPDGPGRRLVGYVISDEHYPSDGLFALQHISNVFNSHDRLTAEVARLKGALKDLLEQIDCLDDIRFSRDLEPYKAEVIWDGVYNAACKALNPEEPK